MTAKIVFCTCPSLEIAHHLAKQIVEKKLAACVNILPKITSVYTWENKTEMSDEILLIIKTNSKAYLKLEELILDVHPYECPEVIAFPIETGFKGYLKWLNENVIA